MKSIASSKQMNNDNDDNNENCHYLSRYVDNSRTLRKKNELMQYLIFEHRKTNTNIMFDFWSTTTDFLSCLTKVTFKFLTVPATLASV